jgi:hypothetical protein
MLVDRLVIRNQGRSVIPVGIVPDDAVETVEGGGILIEVPVEVDEIDLPRASDTDRVYASGYSNGGFMANALGRPRFHNGN